MFTQNSTDIALCQNTQLSMLFERQLFNVCPQSPTDGQLGYFHFYYATCRREHLSLELLTLRGVT